VLLLQAVQACAKADEVVRHVVGSGSNQ
jgi:hypothetical protein